MRRLPLFVLIACSGVFLSACNSADSSKSSNAVVKATRYAMANACWVLKANGNGMYVTNGANGYVANADNASAAEKFYMKPTALGKYMFYNSNREVIAADLTNVASADAVEENSPEWAVVAVGDTTSYPETPEYNVEPSPEQVALWHNFSDPMVRSDSFTITSEKTDENLAIAADGSLISEAAGSSVSNESFSFGQATGCEVFPEAQSNFSGTPFSGTQPDGSVLGHADVHVHISATEFLGGGHWGRPFHKFGIEQALPNCGGEADHGPNGYKDLIGGAYTEDIDGHATDGWPAFTDWPAADNLTHEAIYWKWIERAWAGGLRVIVNDLVDNETLCELQRNAKQDPTRDCNSMNNAGEQAGTMYAMENYIDAQYGGPGKGFFQIVHTPDEARNVIESGKIAVVLGIEISNLFNCKLTYRQTRLLGPEEEPGTAPASALENAYECTEDSLVEQMSRVHGWGVRQLISMHEFDNAFGGNGVFDGLLINVGNRENSGGIPSGDMTDIINAFQTFESGSPDAEAVSNMDTNELGSGEWWTTYNCPEEIENPQPGDFSGYLWDGAGGAAQTFPSQANQVPGLEYINVLTGLACTPSGQHGRAGGPTPCYPVAVNQCNARWMTPMGLFAYKKMMEMGFIIDWDHMALGMKTQMLELAEAQNPVYPFVSTHGTFGGITNNQARRALVNGGFLYPSNGRSWVFQKDMDETYARYLEAVPAGKRDDLLFGFGYGTDTNGLSAQSEPRKDYWSKLTGAPANYEPLSYPFTFYNGAPFDSPQFAKASPVQFFQPKNEDPSGEFQTREWHEDDDGNAHYGMLTDFIEEIVLDSPNPREHMKNLFNSAEAYLRTWERTEAAQAGILAAKHVKVPDENDPQGGGILRAAPNTSALGKAIYGDPATYCEAIQSNGGEC